MDLWIGSDDGHTGSRRYEGEYSDLYLIFTQFDIQYPKLIVSPSSPSSEAM